MTKDDQINALLNVIATESAKEQSAKKARAAAELQIVQILNDELPADGGSKTFDRFGKKFEVQVGWNFKADIEAIAQLPFGHKVLDTKMVFSETNYKRLFETNADEAKQIVEFVACSPKKPAVKIKETK